MTAAYEIVEVMFPLMLFMLVPVWIPLVAVVGGAAADRVADRRESRVSGAAT